MFTFRDRGTHRGLLLALASTWGALAVASSGAAQETPETPPARTTRAAGEPADAPAAAETETAAEAKRRAAGDTAASSTAPVTIPPTVSVQTGAPQPPSQNLASPLPSTPPAPSQAVVKIGGGMILLYSNNYAPKYGPDGSEKKHAVDVWRASIVLDAKLDRYGIHIEFRARDRPLRWMPVNSWLEEMYASVDLIKPGSAYGPLVLKVGKSFMQFGRFWDNSFYGNIHLRDGLKLVPDWGLSFEGTVGAGKTWGAKYYAQYYVVDGQTSTANTNRDTISIVQPGTANSPIGARKRDQFVLRIEPSWSKGPAMNVKLGASFQYFTADFPDTFSPAATAARSRVRDRDNTEKVMRYGADIAGQLAWFGFWAEYTKQNGQHTNAFPFAPVADNPATTMVNEARAGSASDDVTYWLAGANFTYDRYTIQYNYNSATYENILVIADPAGSQRRATHKEWIHNPGLSVKISDQLRFLLEFPIWRRDPVPGLPTIDPEKPIAGTGEEEVVEQQILATLHGKF